jgi:hypothetical protein
MRATDAGRPGGRSLRPATRVAPPLQASMPNAGSRTTASPLRLRWPLASALPRGRNAAPVSARALAMMLSTTGPLMQVWYARASASARIEARPYRLNALSNLASMLALRRGRASSRDPTRTRTC